MTERNQDTMTRRLCYVLLRYLRNNGSSVSEVARKSGVRSWTIYRILDGRNKTVSLDDAARLMACMGYPLSDLLTTDHEEQE